METLASQYSFDSATNEFSIETSDYSLGDIQQSIQFSLALTDYAAYGPADPLTLVINFINSDPCQLPEQLFYTGDLSDLYEYTIGDAAKVINIGPFTVVPDICEVTYTYSIESSDALQTSMIYQVTSFEPEKVAISVYDASNVDLTSRESPYYSDYLVTVNAQVGS